MVFEHHDALGPYHSQVVIELILKGSYLARRRRAGHRRGCATWCYARALRRPAKSESPLARGRSCGTCRSWLRAAGAQRLNPPENDNRVTVLPLAPRGSGWNLWPIYVEVLEDEPTLAAIERTATTTAHKLARRRHPISLSAHQRVSRAAVRAGERLGLWRCQRFYVGRAQGPCSPI